MHVFNKYSNPYYWRLMGHQKPRYLEKFATRLIWMGIFSFLALRSGKAEAAFFVGLVVLIILTMFPLILAINFAYMVIRDVRDEDFELVSITPLSGDDIVWGYFHALLDKSLLNKYILPYGLVPFGFAMAVFAVVNWGVKSSVLADEAMVRVPVVIVSFAGFYFLCGFAGMFIGLLLRRHVLSQLVIIPAILIATLLWLLIVFMDIVTDTIILSEATPPPPSTTSLVDAFLTGSAMVKAVGPWLLIAPVSALAATLVRRPTST